MGTKWIELKDLCELYLENKDSITSLINIMKFSEKFGTYMLFGEPMCSESTEEKKREDQMKAENMLKLAQNHKDRSNEIEMSKMALEKEIESELQAALDEFDRELAEDVNVLPPVPTTMPGGNGKE